MEQLKKKTTDSEYSSGQFMPPSAAVVRTPDHDNLPEAWRAAAKLAPAIFPLAIPKRVLIKPNLCDIVGWENGVTSDPRWIAVLASQLRRIRDDVRISIIESDAVSAYKSFRSCDETFERLGYTSAASVAGVELINLSKAETIELAIPDIPLPLRIPQLLLGEFYFISIANLKCHAYERLTAILKNSLGLTSDADLSAFHPHLPILISWLHRFCPPDLCIIDARIGLEGDGPIMGDPVRMDTIVFSNDALAADLTACKLMGVPPRAVPHIVRVAGDLSRSVNDFQPLGDVRPRTFRFDTNRNHRSIRIKFASHRLHRSSELFVDRWIGRFVRLKREPVAFMRGALRRIARWTHAK